MKLPPDVESWDFDAFLKGLGYVPSLKVSEDKNMAWLPPNAAGEA